MKSTIERLEHSLADIFIACDNDRNVDYSYGGTRMVSPEVENSEAQEVCISLMRDESAFKNYLINAALRQGVVDSYRNRLPAGFLNSKVGGARCVIKPKSPETFSILTDPLHPQWEDSISPIFKEIGNFLNQTGGKIKLTPDFGRFAGLADTLNQFTPHSLGIRCEEGGCGGKSSYAATGVIAAVEAVGIPEGKNNPVTLIGSVGAMGSDVLEYFLKEEYPNLAVCDLAYDDSTKGIASPKGAIKLASRYKAFTVECLERGGAIVATTVGQELENSLWETIPSGTILLLAHNMAIPAGDAGIKLMQRIQQQGIFALPGQVLTLGGALTSRIEWFWRHSNAGIPFDKPLAHEVVRAVVRFLVGEIKERSATSGVTPYEATLDYARTEGSTSKII
ncbi:MAG: hypothetical protein F6K18_02265 [Okeania sp. SIO2C2]|uniref:hypothetical protein n=1 Tax=Okeania sp. SIO2C2 TaxID=2607787 RepID=UPI0013BBA357|nr:hypothetical protein [Okeania sp. SIO2C2]NEP85738.1 hypothetical protein [Okeania sp. SIO2C2]